MENDVVCGVKHYNEVSPFARRFPIWPSNRVVNGSNEEFDFLEHTRNAIGGDACHNLRVEGVFLPHEPHEGRVDEALDLTPRTDGVATVLRTLSGQFQHRYRAARAGGKDHLEASHAAKIARPLDIFLYRFGSRGRPFWVLGKRDRNSTRENIARDIATLPIG